MKKDLFRFLLIIIVMIAFSVLIYPTIYHYDKYKDFPVRENRITGTTELFDGVQWRLRK